MNKVNKYIDVQLTAKDFEMPFINDLNLVDIAFNNAKKKAMELKQEIKSFLEDFNKENTIDICIIKKEKPDVFRGIEIYVKNDNKIVGLFRIEFIHFKNNIEEKLLNDIIKFNKSIYKRYKNEIIKCLLDNKNIDDTVKELSKLIDINYYNDYVIFMNSFVPTAIDVKFKEMNIKYLK